MSIQINKELKKISLLIVIAGMIMGLASPSACDEFYNNLLRLNGRHYEISCVTNVIAQDCITSGGDESHNQYQQIVRRSGNARTDQLRLAGSGSLGASFSIPVNYLSLLLLATLIYAAALSYYHIIFIHLKDGHK